MSRCWIWLEVVLFGTACSDVKLFSKQLIQKSQRTQFLYLSHLPPFYLSLKEKQAYLSGILLTCQWLNSSWEGQILQLSGFTHEDDYLFPFTEPWHWGLIRCLLVTAALIIITSPWAGDPAPSERSWTCIFVIYVIGIWYELGKRAKGIWNLNSCSLEIPTPLLWTSWCVMFEAFLTSWLPYIWNFYWLLHLFIKYLLRWFIKF